MINITKYQDKPLYGGGSINFNTIELMYNDEIIPLTFPPISDVLDSKTETDCIYLSNVHRMRTIISLGLLSGFYFEDLTEEFNYSFTITDDHLIFSVEQYIGEIRGTSPYMDPAIIRRGTVTKEIHYNINTFEIDYVKADVLTYSYPSYFGMAYEYSYQLTKVDSISINQRIADLKEYMNLYSVNK